MNVEQLQTLAGTVSSLIFMSSTLSMLFKTWRTHDVDSYSRSSLLLSNGGNVLFWFYVVSLPFGPIYVMHSFYTFAMIIMLIWYMLYRHHPVVSQHITQTMKRITDTDETPTDRITTLTRKDQTRI